MEFNVKGISNSLLAMQLIHEEFKRVAQRLSMIFSTQGMRVRPFVQGLPHFGKLSADKQLDIIKNVKFYLELCEEQMSEGQSLRDNLSFTWKALGKLGYAPKSDLFSLIKEDDIIEIYNNESRQLYRNFRYFDFCSYSIEELYSLEWWNLFSRDANITSQLIEESQKIFSNTVDTHIFSEIREHMVTELASVDKLANSYRVRLFSPLVVNKKTEAMIVVIEAKALS